MDVGYGSSINTVSKSSYYETHMSFTLLTFFLFPPRSTLTSRSPLPGLLLARTAPLPPPSARSSIGAARPSSGRSSANAAPPSSVRSPPLRRPLFHAHGGRCRSSGSGWSARFGGRGSTPTLHHEPNQPSLQSQNLRKWVRSNPTHLL